MEPLGRRGPPPGQLLTGDAGRGQRGEVVVGQLGQGFAGGDSSRAITSEAIAEATRSLYPQARAPVMKVCRSAPIAVTGTSRHSEENLRYTR